MADFLLIHGSCHGAWCWHALISHLTALGHTVRAIDLPGHGAEPTPVNDVTLDLYAEAIARACGPQTVLVGHSMGGYAITAAAALVPDRITQLIYLCAYVPDGSATLSEMRKRAPRQPLLAAVQMARDKRSFTIDPAKSRQLFYNDCAPQVAQDATRHLCPQAVAPTEVSVQYSARVAELPRHYIRCMNDQTIPPEYQVTMTQDWPASDVQEMPTGHSPFLSDPSGLANCLHKAVEG